MRVFDDSTRRPAQLAVQVNWSGARSLDQRQRNWIIDNIPHARGVQLVFVLDEVLENRRGRFATPETFRPARWPEQSFIPTKTGQLGWLTISRHAGLDVVTSPCYTTI